jgi:hypothetical protein
MERRFRISARCAEPTLRGARLHLAGRAAWCLPSAKPGPRHVRVVIVAPAKHRPRHKWSGPGPSNQVGQSGPRRRDKWKSLQTRVTRNLALAKTGREVHSPRRGWAAGNPGRLQSPDEGNCNCISFSYRPYGRRYAAATHQSQLSRGPRLTRNIERRVPGGRRHLSGRRVGGRAHRGARAGRHRVHLVQVPLRTALIGSTQVGTGTA